MTIGVTQANKLRTELVKSGTLAETVLEIKNGEIQYCISLVLLYFSHY